MKQNDCGFLTTAIITNHYSSEQISLALPLIHQPQAQPRATHRSPQRERVPNGRVFNWNNQRVMATVAVVAGGYIVKIRLMDG